MIENFKGPAMPEGSITAGLDRSVGVITVLRVLQLSC
jgi:hypothetical protein